MSPRWYPGKEPLRRSVKHAVKEFILLDKFSVEDIHRWEAFRDEILRFHWDYYSNLAYQRSKVRDELKRALFEASEKGHTFSRWQRAVKYKYALEPLFVDGSLVDPGGRFNIGDTDSSRFTPFPALYIAKDRRTALEEMLSQKVDPKDEQRALDFALTSPDSIASISLSGSLDSIINLKHPKRLEPFIDLIKNFSIPDHLRKTAQKIGLSAPELVRTVSMLIEVLLHTDWRNWPMQFDVPSACQIFGQLVMEAGIEGVLYPSKFTGEDCLAIFPQNFDDISGSFIKLDDEAPQENKICRLDAKVWADLRK